MKQRGFWRVATGFSFVSAAGNGKPLAGKLQHQQKKTQRRACLHVRWFVHPDLFLLAPKIFHPEVSPPPLEVSSAVFPGVAANGPGLATIIPKSSLLHAHPLGCCQVQTPPRLREKVRPQTGSPEPNVDGCGCFFVGQWEHSTTEMGKLREIQHLSATVDGRTPASHWLL